MNRTPPENLLETPAARPFRHCKGGLFQANLKAYLDGETSAIRGWLVRGHLAQCAECREELRWLRRLGEDMKELESTRPRPELRARILASLPAAPPAPGIRVVHSRPDRESSPHFMPRLALAGGMAMLLAFGGVFALKRSVGVTVSSRQDSAQSARIDAQQGKTPLAPADIQEPGKGAMEMVTYTPEDDPNNKLADKMFHDQMTEMEREKGLLGQDDWHRLMAQARAAARKTDQPAITEMGVSLAVSDIAAVRSHLPTWAKQEGATRVAIGKPDPAAADSAILPPLRTENSPTNMIAFYVPAQRGPAFLGALKQLGQISMLQLAPRPMVSGGLKSAASVQSGLNADGPRQAVPAAPGIADPSPFTENAAAVHDKHTNAARYLVLTVLLQTAAHN